ncbi:unnamed protein product [Boreogadus saida]
MADTTVIHQPATESTDQTPISEIGGHLAESRGAMLKGARGLTFGQTSAVFQYPYCPYCALKIIVYIRTDFKVKACGVYSMVYSRADLTVNVCWIYSRVYSRADLIVNACWIYSRVYSRLAVLTQHNVSSRLTDRAVRHAYVSSTFRRSLGETAAPLKHQGGGRVVNESPCLTL